MGELVIVVVARALLCGEDGDDGGGSGPAKRGWQAMHLILAG